MLDPFKLEESRVSNRGLLYLFAGVTCLSAYFANSNESLGQRGNFHWGSGGYFQGDQDANALEGDAGRNWHEPLNWLQDEVPPEATNIEADHTIINGTDHMRDPIITTDVGHMGRLLLVSGADLAIEAGGSIETERIWIGFQTDFSNLFGDISSTLIVNGGTLISSSDIEVGVTNEFHPGTLQLNAGYVEARGVFMGSGALPSLSFLNVVDGTMDLQVIGLNGIGNPRVDISGSGSIILDNTFNPPWDPGNIWDNRVAAQQYIIEGYITAFGGTGVVQLDITSVPGRFIISAVQPATIDGDYNGDGLVDAADYTVWRNSVGTSNLAADGNHDGAVDHLDYDVWKNGYGQGGQGTGAIAVPEPCGIISLAILMAVSPLARVMSRINCNTVLQGFSRSSIAEGVCENVR